MSIVTRRRVLAGVGGTALGAALVSYFPEAAPYNNTQGNAAPDPYQLGYFAYTGIPQPLYNSVNGRTPVSPITSGRTVNILMIGDSTCSGSYAPAYVATYTLNQTLNVCDGAFYNTQDPILGQSLPDPARPGSLMSPLLDQLRTTFDCARGCSVSIGGTQIVDWITDSVGGSIGVAQNARAGLRRLAAVGATYNAAIIMLGPNNTAAGTSGGAYATQQQGLIDLLRQNGLPEPIPILICQCSQIGGVQSAAIRAAQFNAVNPGNFIFSGIDADSYPFQPDGTHHTAAANLSMASGLRAALANAGVV